MNKTHALIHHVAQNIVVYLCSVCAAVLLSVLALIYWLGWGF